MSKVQQPNRPLLLLVSTAIVLGMCVALLASQLLFNMTGFLSNYELSLSQCSQYTQQRYKHEHINLILKICFILLIISITLTGLLLGGCITMAIKQSMANRVGSIELSLGYIMSSISMLCAIIYFGQTTSLYLQSKNCSISTTQQFILTMLSASLFVSTFIEWMIIFMQCIYNRIKLQTASKPAIQQTKQSINSTINKVQIEMANHNQIQDNTHRQSLLNKNHIQHHNHQLYSHQHNANHQPQPQNYSKHNPNTLLDDSVLNLSNHHQTIHPQQTIQKQYPQSNQLIDNQVSNDSNYRIKVSPHQHLNFQTLKKRYNNQSFIQQANQYEYIQYIENNNNHKQTYQSINSPINQLNQLQKPFKNQYQNNKTSSYQSIQFGKYLKQQQFIQGQIKNTNLNNQLKEKVYFEKKKREKSLSKKKLYQQQQQYYSSGSNNRSILPQNGIIQQSQRTNYIDRLPDFKRKLQIQDLNHNNKNINPQSKNKTKGSNIIDLIRSKYVL